MAMIKRALFRVNTIINGAVIPGFPTLIYTVRLDTGAQLI